MEKIGIGVGIIIKNKEDKILMLLRMMMQKRQIRT